MKPGDGQTSANQAYQGPLVTAAYRSTTFLGGVGDGGYVRWRIGPKGYYRRGRHDDYVKRVAARTVCRAYPRRTPGNDESPLPASSPGVGEEGERAHAFFFQDWQTPGVEPSGENFTRWPNRVSR